MIFTCSLTLSSFSGWPIQRLTKNCGQKSEYVFIPEIEKEIKSRKESSKSPFKRLKKLNLKTFLHEKWLDMICLQLCCLRVIVLVVSPPGSVFPRPLVARHPQPGHQRLHLHLPWLNFSFIALFSRPNSFYLIKLMAAVTSLCLHLQTDWRKTNDCNSCLSCKSQVHILV